MTSRIRELCHQFAVESVSVDPDGTTHIKPAVDKRLLVNGIVWHETDFEEILQAGAGLTETVLASHTAEDDQNSFWAYCAEVLMGPNHNPPETLINFNLQRLLMLCMRAHSGGEIKLLEYLVFPLLEGVTKSACTADVSLDGLILRPFDVSHRWSGKSKPYRPVGRKNHGGMISSVADLLWHLHDDVAGPELKVALGDVERMFHDDRYIAIPDDHNGFASIYRHRNSTLHGSEAGTIAWPLVNLVFMIAIGRLGKDLYEERRVNIAGSLEWRRHDRFFSFYPWPR